MANTTHEDLSDKTLAELHEMARKENLSGTSHMHKDELIEALGKGAKNHGKSNASPAEKSNTDRPRDEKGHFEKSDSGDKSTSKTHK